MEKIINDQEYFEVLSKIDILFHFKKNTPEAIEMLSLLDLIQVYEDSTEIVPEDSSHLLSRDNF